MFLLPQMDDTGLCHQVEELLAVGADVGVMIDLGWAPLHAAAYCGHADVAQALLAKGAEPRAAVLPEGWTALHMAAQFGAVGVVQALVQVSCHLHSALRYWQYEQMQHEVTSKLHVDIPQPRKASLTSGELFFVRPNMPCYCKQGCWISCQRLWHPPTSTLTCVASTRRNAYPSACSRQSITCLLSRGQVAWRQTQADLSALCTSRSVTALHLAAEQGHTAVIQVSVCLRHRRQPLITYVRSRVHSFCIVMQQCLSIPPLALHFPHICFLQDHAHRQWNGTGVHNHKLCLVCTPFTLAAN